MKVPISLSARWASSVLCELFSNYLDSQPAKRVRRRHAWRLEVEQCEERTLMSAAWQPIGPAPITGISDGNIVSGRVTSIAVDPNDATGNTLYIGSGGGVWMTRDGYSGTPTWAPLTDNLAAEVNNPLLNLSVGALATAPGPGGTTILYVGLGEPNTTSTNMVPGQAAAQFYGTGVVRGVIDNSTGQATWTLLGGNGTSNLFYRSAISHIVVDQSNPDVVYLAVSTAKNGVTGNEGIWRTIDGGQNWINTTESQIPGSNRTMFSGMVMNPGSASAPWHQQVLYAAVGEAVGDAANGVYVSLNGGQTWQRMSNLPSGVGVGRITLAISNETSAGSGQYELYAAFITNKLTQSATITAASESGKIVTVDYVNFAGLQPFKKDQSVVIAGVGAGYDGTVTIDSVAANSFTYTAKTSGLPPATLSNPTASTDLGGLYQLGYAAVTGAASDATAAWNVIVGQHATKGGRITATLAFDLPANAGDSKRFNYVGNQGYFDTTMIVDPSDAAHIYVGGQDFFLSIEDAVGSSASNPAKVEDHSDDIHVDHHGIAIAPYPNGTSYKFTLLDGSDGGVWQFDPNTVTWDNLNGTTDRTTGIVTGSLQIAQFYGITANPTDPSQIYGGVQDNGNIRLVPGGSPPGPGTPWQAVTSGDGDRSFVDTSTNPYTVWMIDTAAVYRSDATSDPFGAKKPTFTNLNPRPGGGHGLPDPNSVSLFPSTTYLVAPGNGADVFYGTQDALYMTVTGRDADPVFYNITAPGQDGWFTPRTTTANGVTVTETVVDSMAASIQASGTDPNVPAILYVGIRGGQILVTTDLPGDPSVPANNPTWTQSAPVPIVSTTITPASDGMALPQGTINVASTAGFPPSGAIYIQTASGSAFVTYGGITATSFTDCSGGAGFTLATGDTVTFQNDLRYSDIQIDPNNVNTAYVTAANFGDVTGGGHVWMTTDGGQTWTNISGNLPDVPAWSIQLDTTGTANVLYVGTDIGVFVSSNLGTSWSRLGGGLPNVQVRDMYLNTASQQLLVGTFGRGAFELTLPGTFTPGVWNPMNATWYLRDSNDPGPPDAGQFAYGFASGKAVTGDWNGDGTTTIGIYDPGSATWYLRDSNSAGAPTVTPFAYGFGGVIPVVGDWDGNGTTTIGVYDPGTATWYLRNSNSPGAPDFTPFAYGFAGVIPVVGDWDGNGTTTIGVYDPGTATWYLRNSNSPGAPDFTPFAYGFPGVQPVVGDWNGNGTTTIGVYANSTATWYLRNSNSPGAPNFTPFAYGFGGVTAVTGNWDALLVAAGGPNTVNPSTMVLTQAQLDETVSAALTRLHDAGLSLARLATVQFLIADLPAADLGLAQTRSRRVVIDANAAGYGWFVDGTPFDDDEFAGGVALAESPAAGHMDLLSVVLHELGHLAGLAHDASGSGIMSESLAAGTRHGELDAFYSRQ